jgi:hypothetical protein
MTEVLSACNQTDGLCDFQAVSVLRFWRFCDNFFLLLCDNTFRVPTH